MDTVTPLVDTYGRVATDLRVSLTDRCNLRCHYCMPAEGLEWLPRDEVLTDDEVGRLVRIGVERLGITEVRYTGGEPLLRKGIVDLVARTCDASPNDAAVGKALGDIKLSDEQKRNSLRAVAKKCGVKPIDPIGP